MNASIVGCLIYGFTFFLFTNIAVWAQSEWRVPDPPENVKAKADSKSVTLWWNPPSSSNQILVRGYTISFGIETPSRRLIIEGVQTNSFTIDGLKPNKTYIFALTAYNEAQGEDSEKVLLSASTIPFPNDQNAAKAPIGLKADVLSPSEVRVDWTDLNVDASQTDPAVKQRFYNVEYWNTALSTSERKKLTTEVTKAVLNQLEPNQLYGYRVRVMIRGGGESQWSETHFFRTSNQVDEREGQVEKCDFETPGQCDYVSDTNGLYDWTRVRTENGSSDVSASSFGLLKSPFFNLRKSAAICIQLHYIVFPGSKGTFKLSLLFEGNELEQAVPLFYAQLRDLPQGVWQKLTAEAKAKPNRGFQLLLEGTRTKNKNTGFKINVDNVTVIANVCPEVQRHFGNVVDDETDVDLLVPLQNLIGTDPRVFRTKGLDGLPAVGLQRGVEIVTPYRAHLPRMFFRDFAFLASIKPSDDRGGFLFAVLNAFDTVVDLGVKLEAAVDSQTNISLLYTDSEVESTSRVIASFVVPAFTNQWTQIAIEVKDDTVALYFRCMRYATRQVRRQPPQLQMDDATKLYIGSAGMIVGGGFEGSIQELKIYSDPMEATRQCDQEWADEGSGSYLVPSTRPTIEVPTSRRPEPEITTQPKPPVNLEETRFKPPPSVNTINQIKDRNGYFANWHEFDDSLIIPFVDAEFGVRADSPFNSQQRPHWSSKPQEYGRAQPPAFVFQQQTTGISKGEKGDRGDRGYPGVCEQRCDQTGPMGPQGLRGPPGTFDGLSDSDIARIASWPGVKGEKGDAGQANDRGPSYETNILPTDDQPAYDNRPLRYGAATAVKGEPGQKGQKGEQGLPGPAAPQQRPIERPANELGGGVRVYQTTVELLSSAPQTHVGSLAFSLSDQQLYLRVNNGWQSVKLGEFHASIQRRPSAPITLADFSAKDHLAYWVNDMSGDGKEFETVPCVRRSTEVLDSVTEERQLPPDEWRARQPPMPVTEPAQPARHHHPSHSHGAHSQLPSHDVEWRDRYRYDLHDEISNSRPLEHEKKLHMIALNEPLRGDMGGVRGADLECYRQAREAGYHTTFRAFLSSRVQDLAKMVYPDDRTTPVFNSRGERIFDTWSSIFEGGIHSTGQIYSFNGRNIFDDNLYNDRWLWHGSTQHGNRDGTFCDLWRSSNGAHSGAASPISFGKPLTFGPRPVPCYRRLVVLCVENMSKYNVDRRVGKRIPNYDFDHLD